MKYKILQLDANGRISFTKEELEKLLGEVYDNGYEDGRKTCQYPYWTYKDWDWNKIYYNYNTGTPTPEPNIVITNHTTDKNTSSIKYDKVTG